MRAPRSDNKDREKLTPTKLTGNSHVRTLLARSITVKENIEALAYAPVNSRPSPSCAIVAIDRYHFGL